MGRPMIILLFGTMRSDCAPHLYSLCLLTSNFIEVKIVNIYSHMLGHGNSGKNMYIAFELTLRYNKFRFD